MLKETFYNLILRYVGSSDTATELWREIEGKYSTEFRYYHNLNHLESLLRELQQCEKLIEDWDTILFSLFYHDIIYNTLEQNNEEQSADFAKKRLQSFNYPESKIEKCYNQIIATKLHKESLDIDTNLFIDSDLSILGKHWEIYTEYYKQIRKEYSTYQDNIYNSGRIKTLEHFINMKRIFKTDFFFSKYEEQAKNNIRRELALLQ